MKSLYILVGVLLLSATAIANNGVQHFQVTEEPITEYVECLGMDIKITNTFTGIYREFYDKSGGLHIMQNLRVNGLYEAADMSWTVHGKLTYIENVANNNDRFVLVLEGQEVAIANGNYPNLIFSFRFSLTVNANGDLVSARITDDNYWCSPN